MSLKLKVGDRVVLKKEVERFDNFIAPVGWMGIVVETGSDYLSVWMERRLFGAEDWNNCVIWTKADYSHNDGPENYLSHVGG
tara:strand:+ start:78 stop:323 length:246 start_codon:yes stop_codon:yes gene_type:complete